MGLRISHQARRRFGLGPESTGPEGGLHLPTLHAARLLAQNFNDQLGSHVFSAGKLNALSQLERITRALVAVYLRQYPQTWLAAVAALEKGLGGDLQRVLELFRSEYLTPPDISPDAAGTGLPPSLANSESAHLLHEIFIFYLIDSNPAATGLVGPLHQGELSSMPEYARLIAGLRSFFDEQPPLEGHELGLLAMLERPGREFPESLADQLRFILGEWSQLLGDEAELIVAGLDLIAEEEAPRFPPGPGPVEAPSFAGLESEEENYSLDLDWMPKLVLIAKNTYVWLEQLSRAYRRPIRRLDEIPEEELARFAEWGFTGLWLIGLWQRSSASRRIKELMGNPDAAASAYSLFDYQIAPDLGGEEALLALKERAWRHGVRLAADMVPNHMGIDSKWVMEHPDWFVSLDQPPFPVYSFNGPDLSSRPEVGIYLEDHYYDRSDAAVVFKHVDRTNGRERYIYHGNDGTTMPWNDTAQLDYLQPEVREAVIQTILRVARLFPVIRFDAAMTLARKHYQRLWYPEPGTGGAIASRSEHGLRREQLVRRMPNEFWRDVVERVAAETPDTLLLAEAFWLMEGYFVRTLGMHRVYNSAFMNMLRDQDNAKYRGLIRETLDFDSGILKRYVNFLSNPDERTAIDQFGSDDRYFGACAVLATIPGLPMFAHGQVEGLTEKYGMEFRRPQLEEDPDEGLRERHEREIFPLLRQREQFAGVQNFQLFDFIGNGGDANEDVLAYGNGSDGSRTLVVFNNRFAAARGSLRHSSPRTVGEGEAQKREPGVDVGDWLGLGSAQNLFCRFRDRVGGLEYLQPSSSIREHGLELELGAFKYRVLAEFQELEDDAEGRLARISARAALQGVPSLDEALLEDRRGPLLEALAGWLAGARTRDAEGLRAVAAELERLGVTAERRESWIEATLAELAAVERISALKDEPGWPRTRRLSEAARRLSEWLAEPTGAGAGLDAAVLLKTTEDALPSMGRSLAAGGWLDFALRDAGLSELAARRAAEVVRGALADGWLEPVPPPGSGELLEMVEGWTASGRWRWLLAHSQAADRSWLGKEELEDLLLWRGATASIGWLAGEAGDEPLLATVGWVDALDILRGRAERADYRVDRIVARPDPATAR